MQLNIPHLMTKLAEERPVFHSEADFQHAFAWVIRHEHQSAKIRLERRVELMNDKGPKPAYLDLWVDLEGTRTAIELKYQTADFHHETDGETFHLRNKGAEDNLGYDFLHDLERLERFVDQNGDHSAGHAILLSNERLWSYRPTATPRSKDAFRLHEGRVVTGPQAWGKAVPPTNSRHHPITLRGTYALTWQPYRIGGPFQYLHLPVSKARN